MVKKQKAREARETPKGGVVVCRARGKKPKPRARRASRTYVEPPLAHEAPKDAGAHDKEVAVAASRRVCRGDDLRAFDARETNAR